MYLRIFLFYFVACTFNECFNLNQKHFLKTSNFHLNESSFILEDENYGEWSKWSSCSEKCKVRRQRSCLKINSMTTDCPVKIIRQSASCQDHPKCHKKDFITRFKNVDGLPKTCGKRQRSKIIQNRIFGGESSERKSWPWIVSLVHESEGKYYFYCAGTLISKSWILTAAHCLTKWFKPNFGVPMKLKDYKGYAMIDEYQLNVIDDSEYKASISHIVLHPKYLKTRVSMDYDFALIRLQEPVLVDTTFNFPCIFEENDLKLSEAALCYAVGWGSQLREKTKIYDNVLQEVVLPLVSFELCKQSYVWYNLNYTHHVCAGSDGKDTCEGDSGGGLYCFHPIAKRWTLHGVTSFGSGLGCGKRFGVYGRVSAITEWIKQTIKNDD